jgi:cytoskeletal protein RodZ
MRPKIVIIVITFGLVVFGTLFAIRQSANRPAKNPEPQPAISQTTQPNDTLASTDAPPVAERAAAPSRSGTSSQSASIASAEDAHQAYVEKRTAELMDIAMTDDRANLDIILSELTNRDPEIRKAALEAAIQFGSRDAIPKIADAATQTDDPNEKAALADAIEFLKLPSLTEIHAQSSSQPVANAAGAPKPARRGTLARRVQSAPAPNQ